MYELYPYFTNDGSVGLFSPEADDIYHSTYGALSEAYEKFILPANLKDFLKKNNEIKILDICFGIGYNSKSFLNFLLDFIYNDSIDTYNNKNNDKIYTNNKKLNIFHAGVRNNKKIKVFIHALDTDKNLALLSPFFVTNKKITKDNKISFKQEKIERMLSKNTFQKFKLRKEVNILLLLRLVEYMDNEAFEILANKKYSQFFDNDIIGLLQFLKQNNDNLYPLNKKLSFLHNIYYKYISFSYKKALNTLKLLDFNFKLDIADARQSVKNDSQIYNYIFLDAFTPVKCPCLWTIDFFKELYKHLDKDGMILTYSNAALVRNAFLNAGFYVGKIFSESANKFTGTVAVKNKTLIKHELSEYDLGLLKTKAGIFYRDENLNLPNETINSAHKNEVENSNLISSSKYIKLFKNWKS